MRNQKLHYMVDIETTGVVKGKDKILQVGALEIRQDLMTGYWHPTGRDYVRALHYKGQPESEFAKKHMAELFKECNETSGTFNEAYVATEFRNFIHQFDVTPKYFMGWNASNFDMPFLFDANILTPSFYALNEQTGKEELRGDAHYRIYEQTGSLQLAADITGLSRDTLQAMAMDLNPTNIVLPAGKLHDALYDCYRQLIMQNGVIQILRQWRS